MERLLRLMATVAIVSSMRPVLQARVVLRKTTLLEAWRWGVLAIGAWAATWLVTDVTNIVRGGAADQLWLAAAVLMVSPFVAALGARRPGSRVWTCFVVLPVTVVLYLPAVTAWNRDLSPTPLRLEAPMLAGYGLVLLMGTGNYLGTRFVIPALLAAAACVGVVGPMAGFFGRSSWPISVVHPAATISLSLAAWLALRQAVGKQAVAMSGLERVWIDFRDLFGVVWGRRILDGMNTVARNENWPVRLQFDGFAAADPAKPAELSAEQSARIEQALRWFLRRFVDREWIDERRNGPLPLQ